MIDSSSMGLKEIADACGFGATDSMRRTFQHVIGITAGEYTGSLRPGRENLKDSDEVRSIGRRVGILSLNRRNFLKSAAAAAVTIPAATTVQASITNSETLPGDALNPGGIRTAGVRMVPVVGGKYKVWTKRMGHGPVKVLLLHGGPGIGHEYLEAMESFLTEAGIEMYYYDQLGVNFSDQPKDLSLWTLERYCEEVEEVRRGLGLDNFVLYGHSWGGILAMEYALKYQQHLRGLVISNMDAGIRAQEIEVKYPHLVKALVLVDTTAHGTGKDATADAFLAVVDKRGAEKAIQNLSDLSFGSSAPPAQLEWARREAIQSPEFVAHAAIRSISDADTRNSLSQIEARLPWQFAAMRIRLRHPTSRKVLSCAFYWWRQRGWCPLGPRLATVRDSRF
jgi:pimeloyl-ACP methyl ester carboxylesterase